ncbi:hypothetical protein B9N43_06855 [Denitratisoma sp. DHT3]|uniref:dihydropteroate synthase n=1 Tax=Denitratisoma sp. DHT3 TaxID=1981880 RepID=UPI001198B3A8|nr:hypothetical protein B9N43_06855 [Denitratisoma sp. DHT3]
MTAIIGIVNLTTDSFSDGGHYLDPQRALQHARELLGQGAHYVDLGPASSNPDAAPVSATEQIARLAPVVAALEHSRISVDATEPQVIRWALGQQLAIGQYDRSAVRQMGLADGVAGQPQQARVADDDVGAALWTDKGIQALVADQVHVQVGGTVAGGVGHTLRPGVVKDRAQSRIHGPVPEFASVAGGQYGCGIGHARFGAGCQWEQAEQEDGYLFVHGTTPRKP